MSGWASAVDELARLTFFLFAPGIGIALAVGLRGLRAVLLAPPVSAGVLAAGAVVFGAVGIPWGPLSVTALAAVVVAVTFGVRLVLQRVVRSGADGDDAGADEVRRGSALPTALTVAGLVIGAVFAAVPLMRGMGGPNLFAQDWDVMFHLNATRFVLDTANASSFHLNTMTGSSGFYPAGWHGLAALGGGDVPAATNALLLVFAAVVVPMGAAATAREIFPGNRFAGFFAPIVAGGFLAFPTVFMHRANLANVIPYALVPATVALTVALARALVGRTRRARDRDDAPISALLVLLVLAGVAIAIGHPNGLLVYAITVTPLLVHTAIRAVRAIPRSSGPRRRAALTVAWLGGLAVWLVAWWRIWALFGGSIHETGQRGNAGLVQGVRLAVTDSGSTVTAVLLAAAAIVVVLRSQSRWLLGGLAVMVALAAFAEDDSRYAELTRAWFMDPNRLRAATALVAMTVVGVGLAMAVEALVTRLDRAARPAVAVVAALAVAGLVVVVTGGLRADDRTGLLQATYVAPTGEDVPSNMASLDEIAMLERLGDELEPGRSLIGNPFTGSSFAYAISGVPVVYTNFGGNSTTDSLFLGQHLDAIGTDPEVCAAIHRLGIGYFYFDPDPWHPGHPAQAYYTGLQQPPGDGFELVDQGGTASVYRITACD